MQRAFRCVNCAKPFKVFNSSEAPEQAPDASIAVECPVCRTPNQIPWPNGSVYSVVPANGGVASTAQNASVPRPLW